jgi:hypothetical protein
MLKLNKEYYDMGYRHCSLDLAWKRTSKEKPEIFMQILFHGIEIGKHLGVLGYKNYFCKCCELYFKKKEIQYWIKIPENFHEKALHPQSYKFIGDLFS